METVAARELPKTAGSPLTTMAGAAHACGVLVAAIYGLFTLDLPEGFQTRLYASVAGVLGALIVVGRLHANFRSRAVMRLGRDGPPTAEEVMAAVEQLAALPRLLLFQGIVLWIVGAGAVALLALQAGAQPRLAGRILATGVLFGPLTSTLVAWLSTLRSRRGIARLCDHLGPEQIAAALPGTGRRLRLKMVGFTVVAVLSNTLIAADVAMELARSAVQRVLDAGPGLQRAVATDERMKVVAAIALLCGAMFVMAMIAAYAIGTAIGDPMRRIAAEAARIARGDLGRMRTIAAEDEVWAVSSAFRQMHAHLSEVMGQLRSATQRIGATTDRIVDSTTQYEAGAGRQAVALNQISATTEELARSATQIAQNAAAVADMAYGTVVRRGAGREGAEAFAGSVERMRSDNQAIADAVAKLNQRVQQIGRIVEFINGIADKSDLLALNAELEGRKAGEVGRGFSLVGAEMRRLAENILESTNEIELLIEEIRGATASAVAVTAEGVRAAEMGERLGQSVRSSLEAIVELAGRTSEAVRAISMATQQQKSGTDQLAAAMADILRVTDQSLSATRQVMQANVDLSALARRLRVVVERFRTGA